MYPQARQDKIVTEAVGDELVVYDELRHRAHRLNAAAATVWRHLDGQHSVADLAALLPAKACNATSEDLVWLALVRFDAAHLLQGPLERRTEDQRSSRRKGLRHLMAAGALAALVPAIITLAVPSPAQAQQSPPENTGGGT
jgi:hypothetical protein